LSHGQCGLPQRSSCAHAALDFLVSRHERR
jgi:hypothetical protein